MGEDCFGTLDPRDYNGWVEDFEQLLEHINIPEHARAKIVERPTDAPTREAANLAASA
jgi:hypothetical protein